MRVCVVGGTGNISTSIVSRLLDCGHEVTCYNRGQRGEVPEGVRVIIGDRKDRASFEATMQAEEFDAAIDMISFAAEDAQSSLRAFRGVRQFVHCSTVCTYGVQYDWLPVSEDHPLRPITPYGKGKVEADAVLLAAYYAEGFPVTIIKPSTTYGPQMGLPRQVGFDFAWLDRVRKGKPIVVCGDGLALHQFLHVDDAALCFVGVLQKPHCIGQVYNMTRRGFTTWQDYHRCAMEVLGKEVEMVGVPLDTLVAANTPGIGICRDIFSHNVYYSSEKLFRDVPEFQPAMSLRDGMVQVLEAMDRDGRIPDCGDTCWEDELIAAQLSVRELRFG